MSVMPLLDLSAVSKELSFMLELLRNEGELSEEKAMREADGLDWEQFLAFKRYHHTYPIMYPRLLRWNSHRHWIPAFVLAELKADYSSNTFVMLHLAGEMNRVSSALAEREIKALTLKGPVLASLLYGELSGRTSGDLDVLVPKDSVAAAEAALLAIGYRRNAAQDEVLGNKERKTHHLSFVNDHKGIEVELHWRLNPDTIKEPAFEELWQRRQGCALGPDAYTLGNEDLLVYLVLHGVRHGWSCLRWLLDIDRMLGKQLDWDAILRLFARYEAVHLGGQAFLLANQLLGTKLPDAAAEMASGSRPRRLAQMALAFIREEVVLFPKPERQDVAISFNRYLLATMPFRQKRLYVLNKLYPSSWDAQVLPLPKSLHFLYFPLRPFLWFWRQVKRQSI
ncbi:nucleotidyltransferase family protein [Paenibacillus sp. NEAU-GSW1]|uniref:nucleotidyltransferase domain-containing protein n=1 Tax=Paenibacillus sp. NEAU-GSW1 TaxID=2682486 RepID=UPI0012E10BA1|nr:nucleotidyltransferase family protein [Paenibacillus sp. NEAU-GSW1]MUT68060.1 Renal dipeptidase [Paenibacillus sp. NEAU-GSW1]